MSSAMDGHVIYSFDRGDLPIFGGQQMDVYIDRRAAVHGRPSRDFKGP